MQLIHLKRSALHLFATATALLVIGCGDKRLDSAWWQGEEERIGLENDLQLKTFRYDQVYTDDVNQLDALNESNETSGARLTTLRAQRMELAASVISLESQRGEIRRTAILGQRERAKGGTFEELTVLSGKTFRAVTVSGIDDAGVTIRHEHGSAKLRFDDLTADQKHIFGLEEDLAVAAEGQEKQDAVAYERWVSNQMVAVKADEQKSADEARERELNADRQRAFAAAAAASRTQVSTNTSPLARESRSSGSSGKYYYHYRSARSYGPVYRAYRSSRSNGSQMHYLKTGRMPGTTPTPNY
ncbi:MAG: hypothetical protein EOP88_10490 [Verrucomicrobiaceae bacterium]|nr:MAG: hypothetical protein EOP88_10490 [Verrucomicrobiaceae bacterium]